MNTQRIRWEQHRGVGRSGWEGFVGKRRLFEISYSVKAGESWVLRTMLPFKLIDAKSIGDADEIKAYAERVLTHFVISLSASFEEK